MDLRRLTQRQAIGAVVALLIGGCTGDSGQAPQAAPLGEPVPVLIESDVPYTSELSLDVYHPDASGPWPLAVVFPGGETHKESMETFATRVAERGLVVLVAEYHSYPSQVRDDPLAVVRDGACAVRFARSHGPDFGGAGDWVVTAGFSLGGNVAAITVLAGDEFDTGCLVGPEISGVADGLVGLDAVYDFADAIDGPGRADIFSDEVFDSDEMRRASAINHIAPVAPGDGARFVLFTGMTERLHLQAQQFRDSLIAAGYDVSLERDSSLPHSEYAWSRFPAAIDALIDMAYG